LGPGIISGPASAFLLEILSIGEDLLFCRTAGVGTEVGDFRLWIRWNYEWSPGRRWRKYAAISNQIEAGRRHKRGEFFNQFEGLENHVGGSVAPAALEAIQQPAVGEKRQPLGRHWRTPGVTAQALEAHAVMGGNADIGMNAVAGNRGTTRAGGDGDVFQIDRIANLCDAPEAKQRS